MTFLPGQASAKDLTYRLGVGFKNNTSYSIPSVAGVYYAAKDWAYTASFGVDTQKNYSTFQGSGGIRSIIFFENNLNCYLGAQAGLISVDTPTTGKVNGTEILGVGGVEFFFSGLENLSFALETGLAISTLGTTRIRTIGDDPFRAGVTFYF